MKSARLVLILLATLLPAASASELTGTWSTWFTADPPVSVTVKEVVFELIANGESLKGKAYTGSWLGIADVLEGKIDGDRFSFTLNGRSPSTGTLSAVKFEGVVDGKRLTLTVYSPHALPMSGRKVEAVKEGLQ